MTTADTIALWNVAATVLAVELLLLSHWGSVASSSGERHGDRRSYSFWEFFCLSVIRLCHQKRCDPLT